MNVQQYQNHFENNRDEIVAGHENEIALVSNDGVNYFMSIREAVAEGARKYGYGNFAACACVSREDSIMHFVNL